MLMGKRRRPVDRDEARRLPADGLRACTHRHGPAARCRSLTCPQSK